MILLLLPLSFLFFFFNDTAPTEIYPLSLHDALPISFPLGDHRLGTGVQRPADRVLVLLGGMRLGQQLPEPHSTKQRSEEHTSELQSRLHLVCRLLLEKKKK